MFLLVGRIDNGVMANVCCIGVLTRAARADLGVLK